MLEDSEFNCISSTTFSACDYSSAFSFDSFYDLILLIDGVLDLDLALGEGYGVSDF